MHIRTLLRRGRRQQIVEHMPANMSTNIDELVAATGAAKVDIVFVPGLGEQPLDPWTASEGQTLWPKDFLPEDVEHARILVLNFQYDPKQPIEKYAGDFCAILHRLRVKSNTTDIPIICVAHSLGGVIPAEVLVTGHASPEKSPLKEICQKIQGLMFFGTPFQGSKSRLFSEVVESLASQYDVSLDNLTEQTKILCEPFAQALNRHLEENKQASAVTFYEACTGPRVVDKTAGTIAFPNTEVGPKANALYSNNRDMAKFDDREDNFYKLVSGALKRMATVKGTDDKESGAARSIHVGGNAETVVGNNWIGDSLRGSGPVTKGNVGQIHMHGSPTRPGSKSDGSGS
ncbi:hypothetical protein O1611_g168 [Lasiodiplodia mahajangana]|uniref:Uncharacterized protein n=1 Tax=Lasiodiplodia mahajangana TaxID=1108764 RepID=A0ACC2K123_9PEZI|nr:hypothetical protein O1611_g168 [Lasiodiplodia mahajangana]